MHPTMSQDDGGFSISAIITEDGVRTPVAPAAVHPPALVDQYASDSDDSLSSDKSSEEESKETASLADTASVDVVSSSTSSVEAPANGANGTQRQICADDDEMVPDTDDEIIIPGTPEQDEPSAPASGTPGDEANTVSEDSPDGPDGSAAAPPKSSNSAKKVHFSDEVEVCEYPEQYARILEKSNKRSHSYVCQIPTKLRPRAFAKKMALRLILHSSYQAPEDDAEDALKILEADLEQIKEDSSVPIEDEDIDLAETQDELEDIEQKHREEQVAKIRSKLKKRRRDDRPTDASEALNDIKVEKTRDVTSKFYMRQRKKQRTVLETAVDSSTVATHGADSFMLELAELNWDTNTPAEQNPVLLAMPAESSIDTSPDGNEMESSEPNSDIDNVTDQGGI